MELSVVGKTNYTLQPVSGTCTRELMGKDLLKIKALSVAPLPVTIGDAILYDERLYRLNILPQVSRLSNNKLEYNFSFEGLIYDLGKVQYLFLDSNGAPQEGNFSLMGDAQVFLELIISNLERVYGANAIELGEFPVTEFKNLTFSGENCLEVLNRIATEYNLEHELSSSGILHIRTVGTTKVLTLTYGAYNGLYKIERTSVSSKNIVTSLYAYGSTKNLGADYRNGALRLKLPQNYADSKITDNDAAQAYGQIEGVKQFEDIYPRFKGSVTSVINKLEFFATSNSMFDLNAKENGNTLYLIPGVSAKVKFNSGNLAGYEFEIEKYEHTSRKFTLVPYKDERGDIFPGDLSAFQIGEGDMFVLLDIMLPQSYIDTAEQELLTEAQTYLNENKQPRVSYSVELDPIFVKEQNIKLNAGDIIRIVDSGINVDKQIRITEVENDVIYPSKITVKLAEQITRPVITRLIADNKEINKTLIKHQLNDPAKHRRNWMSSAELRNMVFDQDDYFNAENIKPLSIETNLLSVGAKSSQFVLAGCVFQTPFNADGNKLNITAGAITHYTIADTLKTWNIAEKTILFQNDDAAYLYVTCQKTGDVAEVIYSANQYTPEEVSGYYMFLLGVAHAKLDGYRHLSLMYGSTTIYGRTIKTGVIQSNDGLTKFDLDAGEISGKIQFRNAQGALQNANTIEGNANNYADQVGVTFEGYANAYTDGAVGSFEQSLGGLAYENMVEYAKLGNTIIEGGYIKTNLIDADFIKASVINADYLEGLNLSFEQGYIGGWSILNDRLSSGNFYNKIELKSGASPTLNLFDGNGFWTVLSPGILDMHSSPLTGDGLPYLSQIRNTWNNNSQDVYALKLEAYNSGYARAVALSTIGEIDAFGKINAKDIIKADKGISLKIQTYATEGNLSGSVRAAILNESSSGKTFYLPPISGFVDGESYKVINIGQNCLLKTNDGAKINDKLTSSKYITFPNDYEGSATLMRKDSSGWVITSLHGSF